MILHKETVWLLAAFVLLAVLSACQREPVNNLHVFNMSTAIGSVAGTNNEQQRLTYTVEVINTGTAVTNLIGVTPVLGEGFSRRVLSNDLWTLVDQSLAPGETAVITNTILFDAADLTKTEIASLAPFFQSLQVRAEQTIPLPR